MLRVLLVDDNPTDRLLAEQAFADHPSGVLLTLCASGEEALAYLHQAESRLPDVILLDLAMPVMTGAELLAQLKNTSQFSHIPIVMSTASQAASDVEASYLLHASSYLVKPPDFAEFLEQIDAFITYWRNNRFFRTPLH